MASEGGVNPLTTLISNPERLLTNLFAATIAGYGPLTVSATPYNTNKNERVGSGHINDETNYLDQMREFLGASDRWIHDSAPAQELLTVADTYGRRGSAVQARAIIINQLKNPATSAHFRVLPLKSMTDAELAGVKQQVLSFGYTQPQEAAEFQPPHYITYETEEYQSSGYRFNHGFRFNIEALKLDDGSGWSLLQQLQSRMVSDFVNLMEQIAMAAMMGVNDRYISKKLLYATGARTEEEMLAKYHFNGNATGASWLASKSTFAPIQKENGLELLCEWVNQTMKAAKGVTPTHLFIPPGITLDMAYDSDRTDYSKRGEMGNKALMEGSSFIESVIQNKIKGIEIIVQPTYEMRDSRVQVDQALSHAVEIGQWYAITNEEYGKHNVVQASRGLDSDAPRWARSFGDLYYLDYSTEDVTKKVQSYREIVFAALCFDEDGNLNKDVFNHLEDTDFVRTFVSDQMEIGVTDINEVYPDPWIVKSDGGFKTVHMVGNQDVYHTTVEDTEFAIETAKNNIMGKLEMKGDKLSKHVEKLSKMMHDNYQVSPDDDGSFESFCTATVWENVDESKLESNKVVRNLKKVNLPYLENVYDIDGKSDNKAFVRQTADNGEKKVLMNVPVIDSDIGPVYDVDTSLAAPIIGGGDAEAKSSRLFQICILSGFWPVVREANVEIYDMVSLLACRSTNAALLGFLNTFNSVDPSTLDAAAVRDLTANGRLLDYTNIAGNSAVALDSDETDELLRKLNSVIAGFEKTGADADYEFRTLVVPAADKDSRLDAKIQKIYQGPVNILNRLLSSIFKLVHYSNVIAKENEADYAGEMSRLRALQEAHSNQCWVTSQLVNYNSMKRGFGQNARYGVDPLSLLDTESTRNILISKEISFGPILWQIAMRLIDIDVPFYNVNDMRRARLAVFKDNVGKLPGFSNFESMRCVAEQMKKSSNYCGWDRDWMKKYIKKVIKYVDSMEKFASACLHIFNPMKSSQTHRDLDLAMTFRSSILSHYIHHKKDKELSAKSVFASIILDGLSRNMGMIHPFTDYPITYSFNEIDSRDVASGGALVPSVFRKHRFECTFRYTDSQEVQKKTPFVILSRLRTEPPISSKGPPVPRSLAYSQLYQSSPIARNSYNLASNTYFRAFWTDSVAKQQDMKEFYTKMIIDRLSNSADFAFADYFKNDDESDEGVDTRGDSDFFDNEYTKVLVGIMKEIFDKNRTKIEESIDNFYEAVTVASELIKKLTSFSKDGEGADPTDFKITKKMLDPIIKKAAKQVSRYNAGFDQPVSGVDSKSQFTTYLAGLRKDFINTVSQLNVQTKEHQYPVVNLGLSINGSYWREFDKKMKALYKFETGLGVTLSLLRPQARHFNRFLDVTLKDKKDVSTGSKMLQYKEIVNLGPGDRKHDDIVFMLHKNIDNSIEVVKKESTVKEIVDILNVNDHFRARYARICKCPISRAIGLAYLTAVPSADLMINLQNNGIPAPMTFLLFDPVIILNMGCLLFVHGGRDLGWLGHHLAIGTTGFNSDTRLTSTHLSMWAQPHIPDAGLILQVPHAIFQGYVSGGSGRLVNTIRGVREYTQENRKYKERFNDACDWDFMDPYHRKADRFVCYGGGSLRRDMLPDDINILGNNHCHAGTFAFGYDLPLSLIPRTPDNTFSYPSAVVFCMVTNYHKLNKDVDPQYLKPTSLQDVRSNKPSERGGIWNVWCSSGKQWRTNPNTGEGDIEVCYGTSPLKDIDELEGYILRGAPSSFYKRKKASKH